MKRNKIEIIAGEHYGMAGDGKVILNGVELSGVRAISLNVTPGDMLSAVLTIRVDDVFIDGAELRLLQESADVIIRIPPGEEEDEAENDS